MEEIALCLHSKRLTFKGAKTVDDHMKIAKSHPFRKFRLSSSLKTEPGVMRASKVVGKVAQNNTIHRCRFAFKNNEFNPVTVEVASSMLKFGLIGLERERKLSFVSWKHRMVTRNRKIVGQFVANDNV